MGISLHGGSVRQPGVGLSTGDFERWLKGALEVERLSLWELCEGNLDGGLPCWDHEGGGFRERTSFSVWAPLGICRGLSTGELTRLWRRAPFSTEALLSIMGVRSPGTLKVERGLWKRIISLYGSSVKGTWRAPFLGNLKVMKADLVKGNFP